MDYTPKPEHKFTFGLWTVGNVGRDPFGEPVRKPLSPVELVQRFGGKGPYLKAVRGLEDELYEANQGTKSA